MQAYILKYLIQIFLYTLSACILLRGGSLLVPKGIVGDKIASNQTFLS